MRETNAALLKTERKKSTLIRCYKQKGARKPFDVLQRFWSKLNEFNEFKNGQWSRKNDFNHFLTGWNSFQRLHIDVQAAESDFSNIGAMCKSDQSEDTFSVDFDELEHYFTKSGEKQRT